MRRRIAISCVCFVGTPETSYFSESQVGARGAPFKHYNVWIIERVRKGTRFNFFVFRKVSLWSPWMTYTFLFSILMTNFFLLKFTFDLQSKDYVRTQKPLLRIVHSNHRRAGWIVVVVVWTAHNRRRKKPLDDQRGPNPHYLLWKRTSFEKIFVHIRVRARREVKEKEKTPEVHRNKQRTPIHPISL